MKKLAKTLMLLTTTAFLLTGYETSRTPVIATENPKGQEVEEKQLPKTVPLPTSTPESVSEPEPVVVPEDSFATITSFGDTLCHKPLFNAAYDKETGLYDFSTYLNM